MTADVATLQWADEGVPANPRSWLVTVASRRLVDEWRSESARRRREETAAVLEVPGPVQSADHDDTLTLLFLCCHPSLSVPSQLALTLRAVGGLTTAEIARAFLVPEATMAQRISPREAADQDHRPPVRPSARAGTGRTTARRFTAAPVVEDGRGDRTEPTRVRVPAFR